jgi:hypothetical protein
VEEVARLLSRVGGKPVTIDDVQSDIDNGAPINDDRRMNLLHYAAWLIKTNGAER